MTKKQLANLLDIEEKDVLRIETVDKAIDRMRKIWNVYLPPKTFDKNGKLKVKVQRGFDIDEKHLAKSNKLKNKDE